VIEGLPTGDPQFWAVTGAALAALGLLALRRLRRRRRGTAGEETCPGCGHCGRPAPDAEAAAPKRLS